MLWFTSDTHFNHENIIQFSGRPFASLEEMTEKLIDNWNRCVGMNDNVYHLGDFALTWGRQDADMVDNLLSRLKGNKFLIFGNHDRKEVRKNPRWNAVDHYRELNVDLGGERKQRIVLAHYAHRVWNQMHRGAWMLHGHSHGNLTDIGGKILDVGVDPMGFRPISLAEVCSFMETREIVSYDHHK